MKKPEFTDPNQTSLLDRTPAGFQLVETSVAAAKSQQPKLGADRRRVLAFARDRGAQGITGDEAAQFLDKPMHAGQPRVTELHQFGYLDRLDGKDGREKRKRPTRSGGEAFVYVINNAGRAAL